MDIAGLSMSMASNNLQTKVGTAVLSKAMDTNEALGQGIVQMMDSAAMERSVTPEFGETIFRTLFSKENGIFTKKCIINYCIFTRFFVNLYYV